MNGEKLIKDIFTRLENHGFKGSIVSVDHISELKTEITGHRDNNDIVEKLFTDYLDWFDYTVPTDIPGIKSILIVAAPQPITEISFSLNGMSESTLIPPTYSLSTDDRVKENLEEILNPNGYHLKRARLPLKLLAVRSGLARYGKNNITYVTNMGSFYRLAAFYSDLEPATDYWCESLMLERCRNCSACQKTCPTKAISAERFLLFAERCLTFHNERSNDFPSWLNPSWHHCLVGCLFCQKFCPENMKVSKHEKVKAEFSPTETSLILQGKSKEQLPPATVSKLEKLGMIEYLDVLPRNINSVISPSIG